MFQAVAMLLALTALYYAYKWLTKNKEKVKVLDEIADVQSDIIVSEMRKELKELKRKLDEAEAEVLNKHEEG